MRNLSKDSLETKETFLKLELVRAVHASRNIKHAGNFRKDYLLGAELQEHILRFSKIKYVWRYSVLWWEIKFSAPIPKAIVAICFYPETNVSENALGLQQHNYFHISKAVAM